MLVACSVWPLRWTKMVIIQDRGAQVTADRGLADLSLTRHQSPTLTASAACAAASRATGTRYGEALT